MDFKTKVQSMTGKEIVMAMVNGLQKKHVEIEMTTFGEVICGVCYGCAATNAICEISGKLFSANSIYCSEERADFLRTDLSFLDSFESAIDNLRKGNIFNYNYYADKIGITKLPLNYDLPYLRTEGYKEDLQDYIDYANSLED